MILFSYFKNERKSDFPIIKTDIKATATPELPDENPKKDRFEFETEELGCYEFSNGKMCMKQERMPDDYWGRHAVTNFWLTINPSSPTSSTRIFAYPGYAPTFLGANESNTKFYYTRAGYEGNGLGKTILIDTEENTVSELPIDTSGKLSPNKHYFVTIGDTTNKDGLVFCNNEAAHSNTVPTSALKLLDLDTGLITLLKEDKTKIYAVSKWSDDSKTVEYTESDSDLTPGCPRQINTTVRKISL